MEFKFAFEAISPRSLGDLAGAFYDAFDGTLSEREGQILVAVYAEPKPGETPFDAGARVIHELACIDLCVVRVDRDLVDTTEIAERMGVSRQCVNLWAQGRRGSDFPRPLGSPGGKRIWAWGQIVDWAHRDGKLQDETTPVSLDDAARLDALLANRRSEVTNTAISAKFMLRGQPKGGDLFAAPGEGMYRYHSHLELEMDGV